MVKLNVYAEEEIDVQESNADIFTFDYQKRSGFVIKEKTVLKESDMLNGI